VGLLGAMLYISAPLWSHYHLWPVLREATDTETVRYVQEAGEVAAEGSEETRAEGSWDQHVCLEAPLWLKGTVKARDERLRVGWRHELDASSGDSMP
jgi:hypothetical protein